MNKIILSSFIPLVALIIFFVWGALEGTYQHSWYIFLVAGAAMAILSNVGKNKKNTNGKDGDA